MLINLIFRVSVNISATFIFYFYLFVSDVDRDLRTNPFEELGNDENYGTRASKDNDPLIVEEQSMTKS